MAKSTSERASALRQRKETAGLRQVNLWVPADQVDWIKKIAADLVAGRPAESAPPPPVETLVSQIQEPEQAPPSVDKRKICYGIVVAFPYKPTTKALRAELKRREFERDGLDEWWSSIFLEDYPAVEKFIIENGGVVMGWSGAGK